MVGIILIIFSLLALGLDYYIFQKFFRRRKILKQLYITQALIFDIGVFVWLIYAILLRTSTTHDNLHTQILQWLMFLFILSFFTKVLVSLCMLAKYLLSRIFKSTNFKWLNYCALASATLLAGVMIYGATYGRNAIRVERVTLYFDDLPEQFDGFTIAQFSDTHLGNYRPKTTIIERMVRIINLLNPDIIVQSGDLVNIHSGELSERFMEHFSRLKAPVYAVYGNHDLGYYIKDNSIDPAQSVAELTAKERAMGWHFLHNQAQWIHRAGDSIAIAGVGFPRDGRVSVKPTNLGLSDLKAAFRDIERNQFAILISHSPNMFDSVPEVANAALTLSGHTHAMQAKVKIGNWQWSPAAWVYPMWGGVYEKDGRYLYVNEGIGYALYPMRIGTRPEVTFVELRQKTTPKIP